METPVLYPAGPQQVPADLTKPRGSYQRQAWLAMAGLMLFMLGYIALGICFAVITVNGVVHLQDWGFDLLRLTITVCAGLLTLFIGKSLFAVRKSGDPQGIEITEKDQPQLFSFIYRLADEIGAPRPHRVFLTPEVNAAVFYDLSLLNLIFPSKKNLIIGLGLVNVLTLGELKAVLAHEFGHFAQRSMLVGRWVYIAQQIIGHMLATRDWLDNLVRGLGRTDLRIAWLGWLLSLIIWSIRAVVDTMFRLVIMAERALSREMEFNADLVAVSVTGSDALINALHKLQAADHAWQTALNVAQTEAGSGKRLSDLFNAQKITMEAMRKVLDDPQYGVPVPVDNPENAASHRVFTESMARPPQMWATHPANRDREDNAKARYIAADIDPRSAWEIFAEPDVLRAQISSSFYNAEKQDELEAVTEDDAVMRHFSHSSLDPQYRGNYLNRDVMRNFSSLAELLESGSIQATAVQSLSKVYPLELKEQLAAARSLESEISTLKALQDGDLKPSGGVIRHRGEELQKADIPEILEQLSLERAELTKVLKEHDASCHRAHLQAAAELGRGWEAYLHGLLSLLHSCEHLAAVVRNEQALLGNTWAVITADGQIGFFEKRRMLNVARAVQDCMTEVSAALFNMQLTDKLVEALGVENWQEQNPQLGLPDVDKKNWNEWCPAAYERMGGIAGLLEHMSGLLLEDVIVTERYLAQSLQQPEAVDNTQQAPKAGGLAGYYPVLLPGAEHQLQRKLDLWNRFQLAHGVMPSLARLLVAGAIVGGTIYGGLLTA